MKAEKKNLRGKSETHRKTRIRGLPWWSMVKTVLPLKGGADLIPGQETKISHAVQPKTNKQTKDNNNKKLELAGL